MRNVRAARLPCLHKSRETDYVARRGFSGEDTEDRWQQLRVAVASRPLRDPQGIGRASRCLLQALSTTGNEREEIVETHRPRHADVFHSPWMRGAMLHSPCPMVVTIHDLGWVKRRGEQL